jgi:hypothetical protein
VIAAEITARLRIEIRSEIHGIRKDDVRERLGRGSAVRLRSRLMLAGGSCAELSWLLMMLKHGE